MSIRVMTQVWDIAKEYRLSEIAQCLLWQASENCAPAGSLWWDVKSEEQVSDALCELYSEGLLTFETPARKGFSRVFLAEFVQPNFPPSQERRDDSYLKFRAEVFARDGHACFYCGSPMNLTLDHVVPQSRGGSHDPENLVTACRSCNSSKGAKTPEEWMGSHVG